MSAYGYKQTFFYTLNKVRFAPESGHSWPIARQPFERSIVELAAFWASKIFGNFLGEGFSFVRFSTCDRAKQYEDEDIGG